MLSTGITALVLAVLAHVAMLIGITTPEKFYFDEVHYAPAARQMLEPVVRGPMLNPIHSPLAKQLIALFVATLPISVSFIGTSMATFNRLMIFQNWI